MFSRWSPLAAATTATTAVRQIVRTQPRDAAAEAGNIQPRFPLSSLDQDVNHAHQVMVEAARACGSSPVPYTYGSIRRLFEAGHAFVTAFEAAQRQRPQQVSGDIAAALDDARTRLPMQPSMRSEVLGPLLQEVQLRLLPYVNGANATSAVSNDFPALLAAVIAYMQALGAQPLHVPRSYAGLLPGVKLKPRTHEDMHEQVLRQLQPALSRRAARDFLKAPANRLGPSHVESPSNDGNFLPSYGDFEISGRCALSPDLEVRVLRILEEMRGPSGSPSFSLLEELKSLLGSIAISATERGEIICRLAEYIPPQQGIRAEARYREKLARVFLRFLAPSHLPDKYRQSPAVLQAGWGTEQFNQEMLVSNKTSVLIVRALVSQIDRFWTGGVTILTLLNGALEGMRRTDPAMHAELVREAAGAIAAPEIPIRNSVLLRDLVSVIVDEITWLDNQVKDDSHHLPAARMLEHVLPLSDIAFQLRGLRVPNAPNWNGSLQTLPACSQLRTKLEVLASRVPAEIRNATADIDDMLIERGIAPDTDMPVSIHEYGGQSSGARATAS